MLSGIIYLARSLLGSVVGQNINVLIFKVTLKMCGKVNLSGIFLSDRISFLCHSEEWNTVIYIFLQNVLLRTLCSGMTWCPSSWDIAQKVLHSYGNDIFMGLNSSSPNKLDSFSVNSGQELQCWLGIPHRICFWVNSMLLQFDCQSSVFIIKVWL